MASPAAYEGLCHPLRNPHTGLASWRPAWPEVLARIDAEQGDRPGIEVAVYPCAPLQVLQPATLAPAT